MSQYVPVGPGTGGAVGVPPHGTTVDPLEQIINDPLSPLFSGDTLSLLAEGDTSISILNYETVFGKLLDYLRTLFDIARDDSMLEELLRASFGLADSLTFGEISERFGEDTPDVTAANDLIDDYNDYVTDLETTSSEAGVLGNDFTVALASIDGTAAELTQIRSDFLNGFITAAQAVALGEAVFTAMRNTYLGVSSEFSTYDTAVQDFTNQINNPSVSQQDWEDYQASVAGSVPEDEIFPSLPQLPDLELQTGVPTNYTDPGSSLSNVNFNEADIASDLLTAIFLATSAEGNLTNTVNHYNANLQHFQIDVGPLPLFGDTVDDYINTVVGNRLVLEAIEIGQLIANLLDLDDVEFADVLRFVGSRARAVSGISVRTAGAAHGLTGVAASKVMELFKESIVGELLDQTRYEEILKGFNPLSQEFRFQVELLVNTSIGIGSLFGASIAFNQLSKLELDLNILDAELTEALLTLETLNGFITTIQEAFEERVEEILAQMFIDEGLEFDETKIEELIQALSALISENVLGASVAEALAAFQTPSAFLASELVDVFVDGLAKSAEISRQDLRNQEERNTETRRLAVILDEFKGQLNFNENLKDVQRGDLSSIERGVTFALGPLGVSTEGNRALVESIATRLQGLGSGSFDDVSGAIKGVLGGADDEFFHNKFLVKFNENEADSKILRDNLFQRNGNLTDEQKTALSERLSGVIRGNAHDAFVGYIEKGRELVRDDVTQEDRLVKEASLFKQFHNHALLPPADRYYFEKQQPGKEWMGLAIIEDKLGGSVPTPQVRGAIDFAV